MESRTLFFDAVRKTFGKLRQTQVDGINLILDATADLSVPLRAYILATAWWETGPKTQVGHMTPITERGPRKYFDKYEPGTPIGKRLGNTLKGDGFLLRGRGYVQITGRSNYVRIGRLLGVDLIGHPDMALEPGVALAILVQGMLGGWFTGKRLGTYINTSLVDRVNARRVVNGVDHANDIADYAEGFEQALALIIVPPKPAPPPPIPDVEPLPPHDPGGVTWQDAPESWWQRLLRRLFS